MLLEMDQQHTTATNGGGFMSPFNLTPFTMSLNEVVALSAQTTTANGGAGASSGVVGNALLAGIVNGNGNNGATDASVIGGSCVVGLNAGNGSGGAGSSTTAYNAYGSPVLHANNNNNNSNTNNNNTNNNSSSSMSSPQQQHHLMSTHHAMQHQQHQQQPQQQQQQQQQQLQHHHQQSHQHQQQQSHPQSQQSQHAAANNHYSLFSFDSQYGMFSSGGYGDASNQSQSTGSGGGTSSQQHLTNIMGGSGNNGNNGTYMPMLPSLSGIGGSGSGGLLGAGGTGSSDTVALVASGHSNSGNSGTTVSNGIGAGGNGSSGSSANTSICDQTEIKYCIEELCPVCGDKVSGYHYGLLTCESCKGFFKRTVQNKKVYTCVAERSCHIDKTQRKRCPFCRFQKCLEVGMKLEAVRADRMRGGRNKFGPMYKRDRARKLQIMRQRQLALQTLRAVDGVSNPMDPASYGQSYHMNIKQEIQIPQISSLTSSSPDSSPSPIAIALGQVSASGVPTALTAGGAGGIGNNGGGGGSSSSSSSTTSSGCGPNGTGSNNSGGLGIGGGGGGANGVNGGGGGGPSSGTTSNSSANSIPSTTTSTTAIQGTPTDSKQWFIANSTTASPHSLSPKQFSFDSGSNPTSSADSGPVQEPHSKKQNWKNSKSLNFPRVSPMIREFVQSVDDREWQQQLFSLLQSQSYNQCEVDVFELMCKVLDQNLFSQVDWARNTVFFKDLKVDDQMKLLQNSWSDMLVLDHLHQRIHNNLPDETTLHNGQKFDLLGLGLLGVPQLSDHFNELQRKLVELKFDVGDYICMKFLLLLNPEFADVRGITNKKTVLEGYENVQAALLDYTLTCYPTVSDKFSKLISIIPEIHAMAAGGEDHLYAKHCAGNAPTQTLLMEMLHAKRK